MTRLRYALLLLCALLTAELTLHNHSPIPTDGSPAALAQQTTFPACATTSGNLIIAAPRVAAPVRVAYTIAAAPAPQPVHGEPLALPSRAPPQ